MRGLRTIRGTSVWLAVSMLALALASGGCPKNRTDGGAAATDALPGSDAGNVPGTDATNTDAGGATCTPQMGQAVCADSPGGYGVVVAFDISAMGGAENAPIDQVAVQVDIGGAMFAMPFLDPMAPGAPITWPHMLALDICSPQYGAATVTVEGRVAGTAVATGMAMTVPDAAPCALVMADVNLDPIPDLCGNGVVDGMPAEACDGNMTDCVGAGCPGALGGIATCDATCMWDCSACTM